MNKQLTFSDIPTNIGTLERIQRIWSYKKEYVTHELSINNPRDFRTKICSRCQKPKLISQFYKNSHYKDGLYSKCKECFNEVQNTKRNTSEGKLKVHHYNVNKGRICRKKYSKTTKGKVSNYNAVKIHNKNHPLRAHARWCLAQAIKTGRIVRPSKCENCSNICKPHGHHFNYSKPLDVIWLCLKCHKALHKGKSLVLAKLNFIKG